VSEPRKHHRVPQAYLRGFARQKTKKTWQAVVLDRATGERRLSNVADIFAERDWNTIKDAEGNNEYVIERFLADNIDSPVAPALAALREGVFLLDFEKYERLAVFMSAQLTRGRFPRENLKRFVQEVNQTALRVAVANYTDAHWHRAVGEVPSERMKRRLASGEGFEIEPTNAMLLNTLLSTVTDVAELLMKRTWTQVKFPEPCLFSGENPVIHINPSGETMGFGVITAERIYMPVSPSRALVLSHPWSSWPEGHMPGTVEMAQKLNWAMLRYPTNDELLLHPDVASYPLPGPGLLHDATSWWPWGDDSDSEMPVGLTILLESERHRDRLRKAAAA
jgi:hypothetical protein